MDGNDIYLNDGWVNCISLNIHRDRWSKEKVAEGEWYYPSLYGTDTILMKGNDSIVYSKKKWDANNWSRFFDKKLNYYYMLLDNKIIYQVSKAVYSSNLDGSDTKTLLTIPDSNKNSLKFCVAGDYLVCNDNLDAYYTTPVIVKIDGSPLK